MFDPTFVRSNQACTKKDHAASRFLDVPDRSRKLSPILALHKTIEKGMCVSKLSICPYHVMFSREYFPWSGFWLPAVNPRIIGSGGYLRGKLAAESDSRLLFCAHQPYCLIGCCSKLKVNYKGNGARLLLAN